MKVRGSSGAPGAVPQFFERVGESMGRAGPAKTARGLRAPMSGLGGEVSDASSVFLGIPEQRLLQVVGY